MILALAMRHSVGRPATRMGGGTYILWSGPASRRLVLPLINYQRSTHQYQYVTGGSGASPLGRGTSVFTEALYDGEKGRYVRRDMLGIADPETLPEWAKTALESAKAERKKDKEAR